MFWCDAECDESATHQLVCGYKNQEQARQVGK